MKYTYMTFPNGDTYRVLSILIAQHAALYYAGRQHHDNTTDENYTETYQDEVERLMNDDVELHDWLGNNMNWEDVEPHAMFYSTTNSEPLSASWGETQFETEDE